MTIEYENNTIKINGRVLNLEFAIRDAVEKDHSFFVLFDPNANIRKWGQFPNLICLDNNGTKVWTAKLPTTDTGDSYYKLASTDPLTVYSVKSYSCVIDEKTGKILSQEFFK